jgi:hypothetical protein
MNILKITIVVEDDEGQIQTVKIGRKSMIQRVMTETLWKLIQEHLQ